MPAVDPGDDLQAGLYALLNGDAPLKALASIYDGVPEGSEPPYVVIGETTSTPDGVHGLEGRQTVVTLHTWTRAEGMAPGNTIGGHLIRLLVHRHAALDALVAGHRVWRVGHEFSQSMVDPEPGIRHRLDRFRIWTTQDSA